MLAKRFNKRKMNSKHKEWIGEAGDMRIQIADKIKPKRKLESPLFQYQRRERKGGDEQTYRKIESDYSHHR